MAMVGTTYPGTGLEGNSPALGYITDHQRIIATTSTTTKTKSPTTMTTTTTTMENSNNSKNSSKNSSNTKNTKNNSNSNSSSMDRRDRIYQAQRAERKSILDLAVLPDEDDYNVSQSKQSQPQSKQSNYSNSNSNSNNPQSQSSSSSTSTSNNKNSRSSRSSNTTTNKNDIEHDDFDEWKNLVPLFRAWDFDESGCIDRTELLLGLDRYCTARAVRFDMKEALELFRQVDTNEDESLDAREFSVFLHRFTESKQISMEDFSLYMLKDLEEEKRMEMGWAQMPKLFEAWDMDHTGNVDKKELRVGLDDYAKELGVELDHRKITAIYYEVDENCDQMLDKREFGVFIARFADLQQVDMVDVANVMFRVLERHNKVQRGWALCPGLFQLLDFDDSEDVDAKEVSSVLERYCQCHEIKWNQTAIDEIFDEADHNGDKSLDQREFALFLHKFSEWAGNHMEDVGLHMIKDLLEAKERAEGWKIVPELFAAFDYDGSGSIDKDEIMSGLVNFCRQRGIEPDLDGIDDIYDAVDDNQDGELDQQEFAVFLSKFAESIETPMSELAIHMFANLPLPLRVYDYLKKLWKGIIYNGRFS